MDYPADSVLNILDLDKLSFFNQHNFSGKQAGFLFYLDEALTVGVGFDIAGNSSPSAFERADMLAAF